MQDFKLLITKYKMLGLSRVKDTNIRIRHGDLYLDLYAHKNFYGTYMSLDAFLNIISELNGSYGSIFSHGIKLMYLKDSNDNLIYISLMSEFYNLLDIYYKDNFVYILIKYSDLISEIFIYKYDMDSCDYVSDCTYYTSTKESDGDKELLSEVYERLCKILKFA